ncbi:MAG: hypothetical protein ACAI35_24025 [Candidatus Methylacidiphilales bacterium]|nr:hypothetical protein [Candidatus Methylacidiphilales bacterium]
MARRQSTNGQSQGFLGRLAVIFFVFVSIFAASAWAIMPGSVQKQVRDFLGRHSATPPPAQRVVAPKTVDASPRIPKALPIPGEKSEKASARPAIPVAIPVAATVDPGSITLATLNCMWFFTADGSEDGELHETDRPATREIFERKAGHLIGLLPEQPPLIIGLQEIGGKLSLETLVASAKKRYGRDYTGLFVQGKDTYTGQDVAALFDPTQGWKLVGQPARHGDLERELSKHLVLTLEKNGTRLHICVAHLRVPKRGDDKQSYQAQALLRWVMRHDSDGDSNVVVMGDLNEGGNPGTDTQNISPLLKVPMYDAVYEAKGKVIPTQASGRSLDRIIISRKLKEGGAGLEFKDAAVIPHSYTRRNNTVDWMEYTDHYAVWATFAVKTGASKAAASTPAPASTSNPLAKKGL